MKKSTDRKLPLRKEAVRQLDQLDLTKIAGGDITSTTHYVSKAPLC